MELNNKNVLILGLSKSGIAAAKALKKHGANIYITEGKVKEITSSRFLNTYKLTASSVQGAVKGLLDKDFVTMELGVYSLSDRFFHHWLKRNLSV